MTALEPRAAPHLQGARAPTAQPDHQRRDTSVVIGVSLKMYLDARRTVDWSHEVAAIARRHRALTEGHVSMFVLPSLPALPRVIEIFADTPIQVGAQDLFWDDRGPYTGGVSGADLRQIGCTLAEVGHMERRLVFGEDAGTARRKLVAALRNDLQPVLCVGEQHPSGTDDAAEMVTAQLEVMTAGVEMSGAARPLVIAYEPEWAVGADRPADIDHVIAVAAMIRQWVSGRVWPTAPWLIYGGSAGPGLLTGLHDNTDGLFLGRSAHDVTALEPILDEALALA